MLSHRLRHLPLLAIILLATTLHAQQNCSEEVKLLLSPTQLQVVLPALHASGKTSGRVYFYDTPALDLLSKGVILRLRVGGGIDLTAKLRPLAGETFTNQASGSERFKCEIDLNDGVEVQSFSLQTNPNATKAPETGEQLYQLLSDGQKQLLAASKVQIDWKQVKRIADIPSTTWSARANPPLRKLSLELWQWPGGEILELSTKTPPETGQSTYTALQNLAQKNHLTLNTTQRSKTAIALQAIISTAPHQQ